MALQTLQNFYKATVSTAWAAGTGNRYVSVLPTPTSGRLVVNPSDISKREIVSYTATGTDSGGTYVTLSARGVGGTTDQTHDVNEPVRMNLTAQHYSDIQTELDLKLDDSQLDTDGTLAANSDTKIATQKATKTYADAITTNVTTLDAQNVKLTGNQTISSGVKTFSVSPIVPTPTTASQAATKAYADGLAIAGSPDASTTAKGISEEATDAEVLAATTIGGTGARLFINPGSVGNAANKIPFVTSTGKIAASIIPTNLVYGGTGANGALAISSGTTTIDVGGAAVYILNYTSISITGTGSLAFSNPNVNGTVVIIKSQGAVTLTSSATAISVAGMGSSSATDGSTWSFIKTYKGTASLGFGGGGGSITAGSTNGGGTAGTGGVAATLLIPTLPLSIHSGKYPNVFVGAVGGTGGSGSAPAGNGGGCLIIECAGAFNFTTGTISASGSAGGFSSPWYGGSGGGGSIFISYNTLTANSGTTVVTGAAGSATPGGTGIAYIVGNTEFI